MVVIPAPSTCRRSTSFQPPWSPDGQTLAIAGFTKIVLVPTAGRTFLLQTDESASPEWSPDGRQLAYVKHGGLWLLDAQTHASHRLTAANSD